jgi:hypothetical protein
MSALERFRCARVCLVVASLCGCASTQLEIDRNDPASPRAPTTPLPPVGQALRSDYEPARGAAEAPAAAHDHGAHGAPADAGGAHDHGQHEQHQHEQHQHDAPAAPQGKGR